MTNVLRSTMRFYTGTGKNNEVNVAEQLPKEVKQNILTDFIITSLGESVTEDQKVKLKEQSSTVLDMVSEYTSADEKLKKLKNLKLIKNCTN